MNTEKLNRIKHAMVGKTYTYSNSIHYIVAVEIDEVKEKFTIKTNLSTFERQFASVETFLEYWKPAAGIANFVNDPDGDGMVSAFIEHGEDLSQTLINTLLDSINNVKANKDYIPQAIAINNNVNSIVNIQRLRLDLVKFRFPQNNKKTKA
jgi:hypothetical protein